jgi:hypothetical protein
MNSEEVGKKGASYAGPLRGAAPQPGLRAQAANAVADGDGPIDRVAAGYRMFISRVVVRRHRMGVDVEPYVVDVPEPVDRVVRKFDRESILEIDKHGKQPQAAQAKVFDCITGADLDISEAPYFLHRRSDGL